VRPVTPTLSALAIVPERPDRWFSAVTPIGISRMIGSSVYRYSAWYWKTAPSNAWL
jgi:hypothetical protein